MRYNNGINMNELVDDYIELHRDELERQEFEALLNCSASRDDFIEDLNWNRDDDEIISNDASDDELFDAWLENYNIWDSYSEKENRQWIVDKIQEELDEEFDAAYDEFYARLEELAKKYNIELVNESSRSWNAGCITSQYFWFEDEDYNISKFDITIRFGDAHDNGRNDCEFDLDFRKIDKELNSWIDDIEDSIVSILDLERGD